MQQLSETRARPDGAVRPQGLLTSEVNQAISQAQDVANEVERRLRELRDRLFGSVPEGGNVQNEVKRASDCFMAEHATRAESLHATMADIDRLSAELANRL